MSKFRDSKGNVTQEGYDKYGAKPGTKGIRPHTFPIADRESAKNALKLRGHAPDPSAVIDRVSDWADKNNDQITKMRVRLARQKDKS